MYTGAYVIPYSRWCHSIRSAMSLRMRAVLPRVMLIAPLQTELISGAYGYIAAAA